MYKRFILLILLVGCQPTAVQNIIDEQKALPVADPPAILYECMYNDQVVFYLPPRCCDVPSQLYDIEGEVICSPDGGLTGKGDGRCEDFIQDGCTTIWTDHR